MGNPTDLRYLESHEWHRLEGDICTIGITKFAADELTDITYVDLPTKGKEVSAGKPIGEVESVKATSDLVSGMAGVVIETNEALGDSPELVNNDPFGDGWMVKIKVLNPAEFQKLKVAADYDAQVGA